MVVISEDSVGAGSEGHGVVNVGVFSGPGVECGINCQRDGDNDSRVSVVMHGGHEGAEIAELDDEEGEFASGEFFTALVGKAQERPGGNNVGDSCAPLYRVDYL